jgi:ParB-like chromosome segregation protein Spo0J
MAPAIWFKSRGFYHVQDGNHRINAAVLLGITQIPMLVLQHQ